MSGTEWKLDNDYKTVTITFPTDPPVDIRLDTSQIDEHLQRLGQFRSRMKPDIAFDWALGQKVGAVPDPRYVTEPEVMQGNSLLHIRDPRFGWLHYILPRDEAKKLGEFLVAQAELPEEVPEEDKRN